MPTVNKSLVVPFSAQQMFELINDIEKYPEFLPWCSGAEIHCKDDKQLKASIHLSKGPVKHSITTINTMQPYEHIAMQYSAGPFKHCSGAWKFSPDTKPNRCQISFSMDYEFTSKLVSLAIEPVFNPIVNSLIEAFYKRAKEKYSAVGP